MAFITMQNIRKSFGNQEILHGVSLSVEKGEVVSIIGPSGAGKSTFLRTLNRMNDLIPETRLEGKINIDGNNIYDRSVNVDELRKATAS